VWNTYKLIKTFRYHDIIIAFSANAGE